MTLDAIINNAWLVQEYPFKEDIIRVYELDGIQYDILYKYDFIRWVTPQGKRFKGSKKFYLPQRILDVRKIEFSQNKQVQT